MGMLLDYDILIEPYLEVHINGSKIQGELRECITEVEVDEADSEAHLGRVTIADIDFKFSNKIKLDKKAPIKIFMGHKRKFRMMLDGEITHIDANFGADGVPYLTIGAIDKTNKMTHTKKSRVFKNKTISDIVKLIAKEYGFKPRIEETSPQIDQVTQENETDAQLISRLAEEEAFKFYYISKTGELYFGSKISNPKSEAKLNYNSGDSTIISFRPQLIEKNKQEVLEEETKDISDTTSKVVKSKTKGKKSKVSTPTKTTTKSTKNKKNSGSKKSPKNKVIFKNPGLNGVNKVTGVEHVPR